MTRTIRTFGAAIALALLAAAAPPERIGSSFAMLGQTTASTSELLARPNRGFLDLQVRPANAVTLAGRVPAEIATQIGAKADIPLESGRQLYGWPERPGLYCDLLRHRGLGLSAACLRDRDLDGKFEEALRLDFNSGLGEILLISPSGKIIGARFSKVALPLPAPIAYAASVPDANVRGRLTLHWKPVKSKTGLQGVQLWMSTPDNYTGTEGLSEQVLVFRRDRAPLDVDLYGVKLRVHGFDDKGAMRYSVLGVADGAAVPLLFRGYTFRIMFV